MKPAALAGYHALVLAGSRGPDEPLARYAGVTHKALIPVGGRAMLERVVAALATLSPRGIAISIERDDILQLLPSLAATAGAVPVQILGAAGSPSLSVAAGLQALGAPLLVTTADHALLRPEWVETFLALCPVDADVCVGLARREAILAELPATQRTYLKFSDGWYSGCNLFLLRTPKAAEVVHYWRSVEAERKRPLRMLRKLGLGFVAAYLLRSLSLPRALARFGAMTGTRIAAVEMPFGLAAVDVDKPSDLDLVRELVGDSGAA